MTVSIETPNLAHQRAVIDYFQNFLLYRYSDRNYIHNIKATLSLNKDGNYEVGLLFELIKGLQVYAQSSHQNIKSAFTDTIRKANAQLAKFKDEHIAPQRNTLS